MDLATLAALNAERAARRPTILVTELAGGGQRLVKAAEIAADPLAQALDRQLRMGKSGLVEMTFPGFLAFIEGLLLRETNADAHAPANPRPEVVEEILLFLERRHAEISDASEVEQASEREITLRLIDLILYRAFLGPTGRHVLLPRLWSGHLWPPD